MPQFPHLQLAYSGKLRATFRANPKKNPEVELIKANRVQHATTLRGILEGLSQTYEQTANTREQAGLPPIPGGAGFLLRLPEGADVDAIAHALGMELVAEATGGFMLVATEDVSFAKIKLVLDLFEANSEGGGAAASVLQMFASPEDQSRIERILTEEVLGLWPFNELQEYTFDLSIQTAASLRSVSFPMVKKRKTESPDEFRARKRAARDHVLAEANDLWSEAAEARFSELRTLVDHYGGTLLTGLANEPEKDVGNGVLFADCFQVRVRMSGRGFRDVIFNSPHLFEVAWPEDLQMPGSPAGPGETPAPEISAPDPGAPAICIIDSGIEEGHLWLAPAMDSATSKCFLPDVADNAVQDEVKAAGHGTRVAGAVLYPGTVPRAGVVKPIAWIQNARVMNGENKVPAALSPPRYLVEVVEHFSASEHGTKLFNHSITGAVPCPMARMTAWAAKMDELSALKDVLFIQAAGNLPNQALSAANPGIYQHLSANRDYPDYLLAQSSRVANPAQSLQALTVGSVSGATFGNVDQRSFTDSPDQPSPFSRTGFGMWNAVKPEVGCASI